MATDDLPRRQKVFLALRGNAERHFRTSVRSAPAARSWRYVCVREVPRRVVADQDSRPSSSAQVV
jgi:hypothetical protein